MLGELHPQQHQHQPGHVSLSVLIDMMVQRTYHELTILAELLPRKTDMERKIEIFNFASRTRMLFIRLNALVKWASSASKVGKGTISFLRCSYLLEMSEGRAVLCTFLYRGNVFNSQRTREFEIHCYEIIF